MDRLEIGAVIYSDEQKKKIDYEKYNTISMQKEMPKLIEEGQKIENNYLELTKEPKELAVLLFTSGTTSESKIVMLSNQNIMHNLNNIDQFIDVSDKDKFFSVLPMHHTMEGTCGFLAPLYYGASVIHLDSLKNLQKDMQKTKPSIIIGVPRIIELFDKKITSEISKKGKTKLVKYASMVGKIIPPLRKKLFKDVHENFGGNLKTILIGGAAANKDASKRFREYGFNVLQGYGLTETAPLLAGNQMKNYRDDKAGVTMNGTDIKIVNPDEHGVGEIIAKGPQVMLGYYNNPEATKEAIDEDGYFHTGDLGKFDKDGFLSINGRLKNLIVTSNGKNIYPEELESIINQNEIIKQSVVSYDVSDTGRESIMVEIVVNDEIQKRIKNFPQFKAEIEEVISTYIKEINNQIADYKRIGKIILRDTPFEETSTLKIKRYKK